jgi:hypothetical protein
MKLSEQSDRPLSFRDSRFRPLRFLLPAGKCGTQRTTEVRRRDGPEGLKLVWSFDNLALLSPFDSLQRLDETP